MQNKGCCPQGADGAVATDYKVKGSFEELNGMRIYVTGESEKVLLVAYDIFGFEEGSRVKQVCDQIATCGYKLILIDLYRGQAWPKDESLDGSKLLPWLAQFPSDQVKADFKTVKEYAISKGGKQFGLIGVCWGCWATWHVAQEEGYQFGINWHPSVQLETYLWKGSQEKLAEGLQCPQLILTAGQDQQNMKQDGDLVKILQSKSFGKQVQTYDFPEMNHGWVVRGDLSQSKVVEEIKRAFDLTIQYLSQNFN